MSSVRKAPRVFITPEARERLDLYINRCDNEISGLGEVVTLRNGDLLVTEIFLLEQAVNAVRTDLDMDAVTNFLMDMVNKGEDPSTIKLWWHSHVNMATKWSGTDDGTCAKFANEWMLSIVGNKRGEYNCRVDFYEPLRVTVDNIPLQTHLTHSAELGEQIAREIDDKVSVIEPDEEDIFEGITGIGRSLSRVLPVGGVRRVASPSISVKHVLTAMDIDFVEHPGGRITLSEEDFEACSQMGLLNGVPVTVTPKVEGPEVEVGEDG